MSHKLQLHLLVHRVSANIAATAAIGRHSPANRPRGQRIPLCLRTQSTILRNQTLFWGGRGSHYSNKYVRKSNSCILAFKCVARQPSSASVESTKDRKMSDGLAMGPTPLSCDLFTSGEIRHPSWLVLYAGKGVLPCQPPSFCFSFLPSGCSVILSVPGLNNGDCRL